MTDNTLSKLFLSLVLLLTGILLIFLIFCIFKFGFIVVVGWCATVYVLLIGLGMWMRELEVNK